MNLKNLHRYGVGISVGLIFTLQNFFDMGLDRECMDKPYLIGRATAIVEKYCNLPRDFVALVQVNPLQKLAYHLKEALKSGDEELVEIANAIGDIPSPFVDVKAQFYIGYYHQKDEMSKNLNRLRIGQSLATIRKEKGLSVRQLAELSGVTYQNINKIELGRYSVGIDVLTKITDALDCEVTITNKGG